MCCCAGKGRGIQCWRTYSGVLQLIPRGGQPLHIPSRRATRRQALRPLPLNDQLKRTQDMIEETRELMKSGPLGMDSNPTNKKNGRSHLQSAHRYSLSERFKELARSVSTISEPNRVSCVLSGRTKAWSIFPQEIFGFEKILRQQSRRAVAGCERVFRAWIRIRTRA